jgi:hypothetical protein
VSGSLPDGCNPLKKAHFADTVSNLRGH